MPLEYAVYGVLCAAKHETGPGGARRAFRIWQRLDADQDAIDRALILLMRRGWVRQLDDVLGMVHYEAIIAPHDPKDLKVGTKGIELDAETADRTRRHGRVRR